MGCRTPRPCYPCHVASFPTALSKEVLLLPWGFLTGRGLQLWFGKVLSQSFPKASGLLNPQGGYRRFWYFMISPGKFEGKASYRRGGEARSWELLECSHAEVKERLTVQVARLLEQNILRLIATVLNGNVDGKDAVSWSMCSARLHFCFS